MVKITDLYFSKITKTSKILKIFLKILRKFRKFENKSWQFSYKMARNLVKLRIFIFKNSKNSKNYFTHIKWTSSRGHCRTRSSYMVRNPFCFKILKTPENWKIIFKNLSKFCKNLENSKINPDKFHTKWPKIG